jgi:putative oxidoreductase
VFRPSEPGRYPVILSRRPYGKDIHFKDFNEQAFALVSPPRQREARWLLMSDAALARWLVRAGRLLIAVPFVTGAWHGWQHPGPLPEFARKAGVPYPDVVTKLTAGTMLVGATAVGSSVAPVLGGALLAGSLLGTTAIVHNFWRDENPTTRVAHQKAFMANCGLLGGVLVMAAHGLRRRSVREK